jgi:diketogulonate reductase-like aldo/keto reductase
MSRGNSTSAALTHRQLDEMTALSLRGSQRDFAVDRLHSGSSPRTWGTRYDLDAFVALYEAAVIKPWAVQNRFQAKTDYDRTLRAFCHQHGIVYQSFWTLTANPQVLSHPHLQALARRLQRSPAQVFFRYLTQLGVLPLTGTCAAAHMQDDLAIFEFELDAAACDAVGRLLV